MSAFLLKGTCTHIHIHAHTHTRHESISTHTRTHTHTHTHTHTMRPSAHLFLIQFYCLVCVLFATDLLNIFQRLDWGISVNVKETNLRNFGLLTENWTHAVFVSAMFWQSVTFKKTSRGLARSMWWKNIKITVIIVIVVIVSIFISPTFICIKIKKRFMSNCCECYLWTASDGYIAGKLADLLLQVWLWFDTGSGWVYRQNLWLMDRVQWLSSISLWNGELVYFTSVTNSDSNLVLVPLFSFHPGIFLYSWTTSRVCLKQDET